MDYNRMKLMNYCNTFNESNLYRIFCGEKTVYFKKCKVKNSKNVKYKTLKV